MNRFNSTMAIALVCAAFGTGALAQDKPAPARNPDKTKVAPSKKDVQQQQSEPSNENMDANAQRAHDRNTGANAKTKTQHQQVAVGEVRDWKAIDKNHDNLISPEEMEASLKQGAPKSGKTGKAATK